MRFFNVFTLLLFSVISLHAQDLKISGVVIDSDNKELLPYANIMVIGQTIGTTSNQNGLFELILDSSLINETLAISYVGYQTCKLPIKSTAFDTIRLQPLDIKISEVVIKPSGKKSKPIVINQFKQKDCSVRYSPSDINTNFWIPTRPKEPTIEAIYFPYKLEYSNNKTIQEVWLQVTNFKPTISIFTLRIFKANDNNQPLGDLINETIIVKVTEKRQLIKINLEKYNLLMPDNGIFVGFELLIIDENKSIIQDNKGLKHTLYNPYLNFIRCDKEQKFWLYSKGEWNETIQETPHYTKRNVMVYNKPAISLVLKD